LCREKDDWAGTTALSTAGASNFSSGSTFTCTDAFCTVTAATTATSTTAHLRRLTGDVSVGFEMSEGHFVQLFALDDHHCRVKAVSHGVEHGHDVRCGSCPGQARGAASIYR